MQEIDEYDNLLEINTIHFWCFHICPPIVPQIFRGTNFILMVLPVVCTFLILVDSDWSLPLKEVVSGCLTMQYALVLVASGRLFRLGDDVKMV